MFRGSIEEGDLCPFESQVCSHGFAAVTGPNDCKFFGCAHTFSFLNICKRSVSLIGCPDRGSSARQAPSKMRVCTNPGAKRLFFNWGASIMPTSTDFASVAGSASGSLVPFLAQLRKAVKHKFTS